MTDGEVNTNIQKFTLENGTQLMDRTGVTETIKDLIIEAIVALIIADVIYIKYEKG